MVRIRHNDGWPRRGFALLWDAPTLAQIVDPPNVISLRQFFAMANPQSSIFNLQSSNLQSSIDSWPDDLPAAGGDALVVSGLEGCLDVLSAEDAPRWLETDLKEAILSFQDYYEGQAGLILWLPSGRNRISMKGATEQYFWKHRATGGDGLPIGRLLFSGAENEVERLIDSDAPGTDYDGKHWIGLHHPRIS